MAAGELAVFVVLNDFAIEEAASALVLEELIEGLGCAVGTDISVETGTTTTKGLAETEVFSAPDLDSPVAGESADGLAGVEGVAAEAVFATLISSAFTGTEAVGTIASAFLAGCAACGPN